jgi:hypothetical protein
MKINTTIMHHLTLVKIVIIPKKNGKFGDNVEKGNSSTLLGGT